MKKFLVELLIIVFLISLVCLYLPQLVFQYKIPSERESLLYYFPLFKLVTNIIKSGYLPLWNPYYSSGTPLLANPHATILYPINFLLFRLFPYKLAYPMVLSIHFFLAGFFTYLLSKKIGLSRLSALLSAICYMFSSWLLNCIYIPVMLFSSLWLPVILYLVETIITNPRYSIFSLACVSVAVASFSGCLQIIYGAFLVSVLYGIFKLIILNLEYNVKIEKIALYTIMDLVILIIFLLAVIISITLPQKIYLKKIVLEKKFLLFILAYALFLLISIRLGAKIKNININFRSFIYGTSIVIAVFFCGFLLSAIQLVPTFEWSKYIIPKGNLPICTYLNYSLTLKTIINELFTGAGLSELKTGIFIGTTAFLLILSSFFTIKRHFLFYVLFFSITVLLSLACVIEGPNLFFLSPFLQRLFFPYSILCIVSFSLSILAGLALENLILLSSEENDVESILKRLAPLIIFWLFLTLVLTLLGMQKGIPLIIPGFCVIILFYLFPERFIKTRLLPGAIILFNAIELHPIFAKALHREQRKLSFISFEKIENIESHPAIKFIKRDKGLFRIAIFPIAEQILFFDLATESSKASVFFHPNYLALAGLYSSHNDELFPLKKYNEYLNYLREQNLSSVLLQLLNIKYLLSNRHIESLNYSLVYDGAVKVYCIKKYLPRLYLVHQAKVSSDRDTIYDWLTQSDFDPKNTVILNENYSQITERLSYKIGEHDFSRLPYSITAVSSANMEQGFFASIKLNKDEIADNKRGYNIAVIDPISGDLDDAITFNPASSRESVKFVNYLLNIPDGKLVVLADKGASYRYLSDAVIAALNTIGAKCDFSKADGKANWCHVIIGIKGASVGTALESFQRCYAKVSLPYSKPVLYRFRKKARTKSTQELLKLVEYKPNRIICSVNVSSPAFLVLSEVHYPGWRVYVDNQPQKILQVNGIFRAIYLEEGNHMVKFCFLPNSFVIGSIISSLSLLILLIIPVINKRRILVNFRFKNETFYHSSSL